MESSRRGRRIGIVVSVVLFALPVFAIQARADGRFKNFYVPTTNSWPYAIAVGSDGAAWFTEYLGNRIGRVTNSGDLTEFFIPTTTCRPYDITAGPDGALWFTEKRGQKIGRITTAGVFTEFRLPPQRGPQ